MNRCLWIFRIEQGLSTNPFGLQIGRAPVILFLYNALKHSIWLVNVLFLQFSRNEVNKDEPKIFYWIYIGFFWTQCITTVVLAVFIAANKNEDGPTFMVKVTKGILFEHQGLGFCYRAVFNWLLKVICVCLGFHFLYFVIG